jgi:hypothetical protein
LIASSMDLGAVKAGVMRCCRFDGQGNLLV